MKFLKPSICGAALLLLGAHKDGFMAQGGQQLPDAHLFILQVKAALYSLYSCRFLTLLVLRTSFFSRELVIHLTAVLNFGVVGQ